MYIHRWYYHFFFLQSLVFQTGSHQLFSFSADCTVAVGVIWIMECESGCIWIMECESGCIWIMECESGCNMDNGV